MDENLNDFGREIGPNETFRFECHPGLGCFGACCRTEIRLTPYDIARLRRHLGTKTDTFLSAYATCGADTETGFPLVTIKRGDDGTCVFSEGGRCAVYESRPSCCRNYPLARVVDEDGLTGERLVCYRLQQGVDYCDGFGSGPEWTVEAYCEENRLRAYEKANDLFFEIPFNYYTLPHTVRHNRDVQQMIFEAVFNFDKFFKKYGQFPHTTLPDDDDQLIILVRSVALGLIEKAATEALKD
jgi:Fe-S-cluster containining protein